MIAAVPMFRKASEVDMIAANSAAKTMPASNGLANIARKVDAASSGCANGSAPPPTTTARITRPIEIHSSAATI